MYEQQRKQIREHIIDTAVRLFREKGYGTVTVEEVTKAVGVAKGTFYNFFKSKRDILMAWAAGQFAGMDLAPAIDGGSTVLQNLHKLVDTVCAKAAADSALFMSFLQELVLMDRGALPVGAFDFEQVLSTVLLASSDFRRVGEPGLALKVHVLNSLLFAEMLDWMRSGQPIGGMAGRLKEVADVCIHGIYE